MCGIVGYVGAKRADLAQLLVGRLALLEYRGYDSAGVAVLDEAKLTVARAVGGLAHLTPKLAAMGGGGVGFAHTRWATHGAATERNAHPFVSPDGRCALVLNGVIENDWELRRSLGAFGIKCATENDAETMLHLLVRHYSGDLAAALSAVRHEIAGSYAVCVMHRDQPGRMVCAKHISPLVAGRGKSGVFVASDAAALHGLVDDIYYLNDGEVLEIWDEGRAMKLTTADGWAQKPALSPFFMADASADKCGFESFTLKEIHEQPAALQRGLAALQQVDWPSETTCRELERVVLVGCGSAFLAGSMAKILIEREARIPAAAEIASEFRTQDPFLTPKTLVVLISQSGETADTLACLNLAKAAGAQTLAICNVVTSSIARGADGVVPLSCGPEIGVASTKAYTSMLLAVAWLALELASRRGHLNGERRATVLAAARELPSLVARVLAQAAPVEKLAGSLTAKKGVAFIGRSLLHASALEGALKLRELAYVNAEGFAGGELKHGSIALLEPGYPVVAIAPRDRVTPKMIGSVQAAKARGAHIIGVLTEGDLETASLADDILPVPATDEFFLPIVVAPHLQLLAYHVAKVLGRTIDRPRNLAKSVTVD